MPHDNPIFYNHEAAYFQVSSGKLMTIGSDVLRTTTHRNGVSFARLISRCTSRARDVQKVARARRNRMFPALAPLNVGLALQHVRNGFLRAMMMDAGLRSWLDHKNSAPQPRVNPGLGGNRREPQRTGGLRSALAELVGMDDADGERIAFVHVPKYNPQDATPPRPDSLNYGDSTMPLQKSDVWLITGCSTGFGRELAKLVLDRGFRAVITARDAGQIQDLAANRDGRALALQLDVTDRSQVEAAVKQAEAKFGSIDVLVNNAGYGYVGALEESDETEVRSMVETNFFGLARMIHVVLPGMRRRRHGSIVNISSIGGLVGFPGVAITTPPNLPSRVSPRRSPRKSRRSAFRW